MWLRVVVALMVLERAASAECTKAAAFDQATFEQRVGLLASKELDGRAPGSAGDAAARAMIVEQLTCLGLQPAFDGSFEQPFTANNSSTANVAGFVLGSDPVVGSEIILVAAHHDHLGKGYLGANDNASGVVALLAVAQHISEQNHVAEDDTETAIIRPKRTIVFAAFGAEETGMHGSYYYAQHAPAALPVDRIVQVINLDMVGSYKSRGFVAAMGTFPGLTATSLLAKLDDRYPQLRVGLGGKARGSDFEPFCKLGTPYVFFWTPDKRCYHAKCDTADRLDYPRMVDIAALAGDLTLAMANTIADLAAAKAKHGCFARKR